MGIRLTMSFAGDEAAQVDRVLFGLGKVPDDMLDPDVKDSAGQEIVDSFREIVEEQIESGGNRGSTPYAPLSPRYKARKPEGLPTLVLTGAMRKALTQPGGANLTKFSDRTLTLGVKEGTPEWNKLVWHQGGTKKDGVPRMPARPPIVIKESDKREWIKFIQNYVRVAAGPLAEGK